MLTNAACSTDFNFNFVWVSLQVFIFQVTHTHTWIDMRASILNSKIVRDTLGKKHGRNAKDSVSVLSCRAPSCCDVQCDFAGWDMVCVWNRRKNEYTTNSDYAIKSHCVARYGDWWHATFVRLVSVFSPTSSSSSFVFSSQLLIKKNWL